MKLLKRLLVVLAMLPIAYAAHAAPFIYVPTNDNQGRLLELSVIDAADGSHAGQTLVRGLGKVQGIAFHPTSNQIYVALTNSISVINTADNSVSLQIDVPAIVRIIPNPDVSLLYIETDTDTKVLNTATNTLVGTSTLMAPYQIAAFSPDGARVYRIVEGTGTGSTLTVGKLEVVNVATGSVIGTFDVGYGTNKKGTTIGGGTHDIAVNATGTRVYVMNGRSPFVDDFNSVSVFDTTIGFVMATIPVGNLPAQIAINPDGTRVYVANVFSEDTGTLTSQGKVTVIDTASNTVIDRIPFGESPRFLGLDPAGTLYVQSQKDTGASTLSVIDGRCNTITGQIAQTVVGGFFERPYLAPANVVPPAAGVTHVQITGMEVTQGIQNLANEVPLYGGRRTFVRVHVKSDGPVVNGITAILSGVGNIFCSPGSCPPSGASLGPLVPINSVGTRLNVGPNPKRYDLNHSFLFELPWQWTNYQSLHLLAAISQGPGLVPTQSCRNDVVNAPLFEFETGFDTIKVQFVRLSYELPVRFNGIDNQKVEASVDDQLASESYIRRAYPISDIEIAPDYPLTDKGLGFAVARVLIQCAAMAPEDRSLCARNYISDQLAMLQASTGFMGDANVIYGLIPLIPNDPDELFFARGACCTNNVGAGPSPVFDYAAHEVGHFLGRQHPVEGAAVCEHSATDPDFPYYNSLIAPPLSDVAVSMQGFDRGDLSLTNKVEMTTRSTFTVGPGTNTHFDIMGYCRPSWVSDYTYKHMHTCLEALHGLPGITPGCGSAGNAPGPGTPQPGDWLTVFGDISRAGTAHFIARRVDRNYAPPLPASGTHKIRLTGAAGAILAEYPFTPREVDDGASESFGEVVPYVAGTQAIEVVDSTASAVIGQKAVSPNAPAVSGAALQGAPDPTTGLVTLTWNASDADADTLTYDIFFTRDLGGKLQPLMLGLSEKSAQIDTSRLAGGSAQFRVVASDGVQSGFADTPTFTLSNKAPKPRILNPGDGSTIHVGQLINIEGSATDALDGVIAGTHLTWSVGGQSLGTGSRLSITDLPAGVSQLSLTATNSVGLSATTTASVTVLPNVDMPGPTLTAGPTPIGWHLATGDATVQSAPLEISNSGGGSLAFTAVSNAPWLTLSASTGTAPATITLSANPAGFVGGNTGDATVTVTATGLPGQEIQIPVTLSVGNTFVVARTAPGVVAPPPPPPPPADFAIGATLASGSTAAGQTAQTTLTVTPSNGFHGSVALTCSGLPASATCSFSPASLDVDAAAATTTLTIATTTRTAMNSIRGPINPLAPGGVILAALCVPLGFRRRRYALLALLLVGAIALHGCSSGGGDGQPGSQPVGTPAGTYNVTITATSGTTTHTVVYALTVT